MALKPLHEQFLRLHATTGLPQVECMRRARVVCGLPERSDSSMTLMAWKVLKRPAAQARLAELRKQYAPKEKAVIAAIEHKMAFTREWVIDQLIGMVTAAKADKNYNAVNKSLHLLGLELGMFATVVRHGATNDAAQLTDAELIEIIRSGDLASGGAGTVSPPEDKSKLN